MECEYVGVLPDPGKALSQLFTYRVPEPLRASARLGAQVLATDSQTAGALPAEVPGLQHQPSFCIPRESDIAVIAAAADHLA